MRVRRKHINQVLEQQKYNKKLRYIDPLKVKRLLGSFFPSGILAKLIDVDLIALNDEAVIRMGGGDVKPKYLSKEYESTVLGVVDEMEKYNRKLVSHSEIMRDRSFYSAPFDLTIRYGSKQDMPRFHESWSEQTLLESTVQVYNLSDCKCRSCYRPPDEHRAILHIYKDMFNGHIWRISVPIQYLMKGFPLKPNGHMGYYHSFVVQHPDSYLLEWLNNNATLEGIPEEPRYNYVGITSRNWLIRMKEHIRGIESGENKKFYNSWRHFAKNERVDFMSELIVANQSYDDIMAWEEARVDIEMAEGRALNMIPGGFKGIRELHKLGVLNKERPTLKERLTAIEAAERANPRSGVPNLLISELWKEDSYAAKIICGAEGRLSVEQVRTARDLNLVGISVEDIADKIGALNVLQVKRLLDGKTYSRVH
ncbi:hypothetical protein Q4Q49_10645 [Shewanella sp. SP1S1-7]|uniref:hypothetical protein n=1 Tax=Shewanella sp. SP1S1-7 TaxID=3063536 RepID=UPI0028910093|nr:hypothetical protein [Shewanella sp. SP1S1-7]MDT3335758.1 hypothetical protein [Shewanella sp. SP1S1-7]